MDKNSSIALQNNIKNNTEELQDFLKDLNNWEKDIKLVDEKLSGQTKEGDTDVPPIRCKNKLEISSSSNSVKKKSSDSNSKRKKKNDEQKTNKERIKSYDYAAWEKFDVDKALDSSEEEVSEAETRKSTSTAKGLTKEERAVALKEEGNKCYSSGKLDQAIAKYTQAMALDPSNPILPANRAMAYIKMEKYTAAETDCIKCLKLDPKYIKAYLRRGTSRINLGKVEAASEDFSKVLELEPWNKEAKKELEKLKLQTKVTKDLKSGSDKSKTGSPKRTQESSQGQPQKSVQFNEARGRRVEKKDQNQETKASIKKLKIEEVNSSCQDQNALGADAITPIEKPPHLRSTKPLKRISVLDVPTREAIENPSFRKVEKEETQSVEKPQEKNADDLQKAKGTSSVIAIPKLPRTSHQFSQDWSRVSRQKDRAIQYLRIIPPTFFNNVDLETETFIDVLKALSDEAVTSAEASSYLTALSKSSGFSVLVMFLDDDQKKVIHTLVGKCEKEEKNASEIKEIEKLLL